mmetsp:Transcript_40298/g.51892  ORF Transcript_40298/g.51892 Transcript_40298/m.51892 type:complete len:206 (+) Transcript_40298:317-934(+)
MIGSMLEGLKSIGNKRKKNMGCVSGSVSGPPPAPFPSMIQGVKSLGMVDQTLVPPLQGTDHLHSFAIPPLPPPAEPILPVCEECRQRKKSKKYCREELKHDAPPWNADKPVKESKRRKKKNKPPVSKSLSLIPTPSVPKALSLKPAPPSLPRANTLLASFLAPSRPLPMPIKHGLNPPSLLPLPVECDEFSDEDLDEDPNGEIHV